MSQYRTSRDTVLHLEGRIQIPLGLLGCEFSEGHTLKSVAEGSWLAPFLNVTWVTLSAPPLPAQWSVSASSFPPLLLFASYLPLAQTLLNFLRVSLAQLCGLHECQLSRRCFHLAPTASFCCLRIYDFFRLNTCLVFFSSCWLWSGRLFLYL